MIAAAGAHGVCVNGGGDIQALGSPAPGTPWRLGVVDPLRPGELAAVVEGEGEMAVATSGTAERGRHVLDPHTGAPPHGVLAATVSGPDLATADAYATAALAMGASIAPHWVARLRGYGALLILEDERMLSTPSFGCAPQ
jgi:thiamine biosynthesis lipoprotein